MILKRDVNCFNENLDYEHFTVNMQNEKYHFLSLGKWMATILFSEVDMITHSKKKRLT